MDKGRKLLGGGGGGDQGQGWGCAAENLRF